MLEDASQSTVMVFSHPNHEIAIFGLLQRLKPNIIFLTDGGGGVRLTDSETGLASVNLMNRAVFLNYPESSFYQGLLTHDHRFFKTVVERVAGLLERWQPSQILCDAVEFYNPVHDLSLPLVTAAAHKTTAKIFEVPLMYQKSAATESYDIQRFPPSKRAQQIEVSLNAEEVEQKLSAANNIYKTLINDLPSLSELPTSHAATEVVAPALSSLPKPLHDQTLRYNWRGELLLKQGLVEQLLTYDEHYVPVAARLLNGRN